MAGNIGYIAAPSILSDLYTLLDGLTYPVSTETGRTPDVYFMGTHTETADEMIELMGAVRDGDIEWKNTGRIMAESFDIQIDVVSTVMGQTGLQALARVEALANVVEAGLKNQTTGAPTGLTDARIIDNYALRSFELDPIPIGDNGWGFRYTLNLRVNTRH